MEVDDEDAAGADVLRSLFGAVSVSADTRAGVRTERRPCSHVRLVCSRLCAV